MKLARLRLQNGSTTAAIEVEEGYAPLEPARGASRPCLADILHSADPAKMARELIDPGKAPWSRDEVSLLAPIDRQEVWAAGVTYRRSRVARMEESAGAASHYDRVYEAERPELFFKATAGRVSGPGEPVRVRADSRWSVPEPELALVISPAKKLVGFTIGNDMTARDLEGDNPLYLPQAKIYRQSAALGPCVWIPEQPIDRASTRIVLTIVRQGSQIFEGQTRLDKMVRGFDELIGWLGRDNEFPNGVFLMTGTGIVPSDDVCLQDGDLVNIEIAGIGMLSNPVVQDLV